MNYYPFDSRNKLYRSNIGAVAADSVLQLRLLLHRDAAVYEAFLRVEDDRDGSVHEIKMTEGQWLNDYRFYQCEISLSEGLYWYDFRYSSKHGEFFVAKEGSSLGVFTDKPGVKWQQTVYQADFKTPDWLKGGIIYQIFPDRFYNSGKCKQNIPSDRYLCKEWGKIPEHRQNCGECSLGNDYYGGDLKGIEQKLPYLKKLGVSCIYLNPIFEAHSNHRYNTANYRKIDMLLGSEKDFTSLCKAAESYGVAIILDGVFSHTGDDSIYFNKKHRYGEGGAYNNPSSPYHSWFKFRSFPDDYSCWWGVPTLPETNEDDPSFTEFITGKNGILRKWLRLGAKGWRLDVADELPDAFLKKTRWAMKQENPDAFLLGEVWEDATNKVSYGARRKFLRGEQLDSVMNYPFANGIIDFIKHGDAQKLNNLILDILENYPSCAVALLMNHIGTHDTARILTALAKENMLSDRNLQALEKLTDEEYELGKKRLKAAAVIQYTLPGVPSLYYGDEAGMQGYGDPFCRGTYPWGKEDNELLEFYIGLGDIRRNCNAFICGEFATFKAESDLFAFTRESAEHKAFIAVNRGSVAARLDLPDEFKNYKRTFGTLPQGNTLNLEPLSYTVICI